MSKNYLITISRRHGTANSKNILRRIEYTAQLDDVANGLNPAIFTRRMV
jgi:hypothetical protein